MNKWISKADLDNRPELTDSEAQAGLREASEKILKILPDFTSSFPGAYSTGGIYPATENTDWTTGFWTGEIWLAYEYTGDERLLNAAKIQIESFLRRIEKKIGVETHDLGFLYSPSCVAGFKLTGSETGRTAALKAAGELLNRFQEKGQFIQAWGPMDDPENYRLIIDCLLNLPLLYWAYDETKNERFRLVADAHINTALGCVIRDDFSTWHTYFFDRETGALARGATCQGYRDGSAWARGQAWGVYGTAIGYRYRRDPSYIPLFRGVTEYFLSHLPDDLVPFWDLEFGNGDAQPRDSSSASIAACGMLEMSRYLNGNEKEAYIRIARKLMKSVYDNYAARDEKTNGLVLHSTYSNHSPYNTCNHYGVDECNIWGDYFYMEALTRLSKNWKSYW